MTDYRVVAGVRLIPVDEPARRRTGSVSPAPAPEPVPVRNEPAAPTPPVRPAPAPRQSTAPEPRVRSSPARTRPASSTSRRLRLAPLWVPAIFLLLNLPGLTYYLLPISDRVRHPLHQWFKPSGHVGQAAGVLAFAMFMFLYLYPLRKRVRTLRFLGSLPRWLDVHIVAGLSVPIVGAMHAGWRFQGLIGLGYASMLAVSLSGIVGRYLYMHIPRRRSGVEMSLEEIDHRRAGLVQRIAAALNADEDSVRSILESAMPRRAAGKGTSSLFVMFAADSARRRAERVMRKRLRQRGLNSATRREAIRLVRRHLALTEQLRMLDATQRLFRLWHVVHRPFSITAFAAVGIHVVVAISLGVTWFW